MAHVSDQSSKRSLETSNESVSNESVSGEPTAKKSKKTAPTSAHSNVAVNSKKKTAIDANAPKRANTAFILFSQAERANIKKECPDVSNAEIFKRLGEKWREASAETKAKYEAEYKANKANKASASGSAPPHTQDTVVVEESCHGGCAEPTAITEPVSTPAATPDDPAPVSSLSALLKSKPQQTGGGKARKSKTPAPATMRVSETLSV